MSLLLRALLLGFLCYRSCTEALSPGALGRVGAKLLLQTQQLSKGRVCSGMHRSGT